MAQVSKIDANVTGLRYAEEASIGVLPGSPVWKPLEPNSYADFGGQITTTPRAPIQPSRQRKKGVTTDLEASGGFNTDLTQENLKDLLQGYLFADMRPKPTNKPLDDAAAGFDVTNVDGTTEDFEVPGAADESWDDLGDFHSTARPVFVAGHLILTTGFTNAANNGLFLVSAVTSTNLTAAQYAGGPAVDLVDETPPSDAEVSAVGFQFGSGDAEIDVDGDFPALITTTQDLTVFGLKPGEWIFVGGDDAATQFDTAVYNGFWRIRAVDTNRIDFDKSPAAVGADDTGAGKTIHVFFGRVIQNEQGPSADPPIKRRTYQLERELGAPDDSAPTDVQGEYLIGQVPGEFTMNVPNSEKVTCDLTFLGQDHEPTDAADFPKSGSRPSIEEADAFNTSSDFTRIRLAVHDDTDPFPTPLFAFVQEITLTVNNNLSPAKAVGVLGNCEISAGDFQVSGSMTAYFSNVSAMSAVRNNSEVTFDVHLVKQNAGISIDVPLITLGEGRANVEKDQKITLPLGIDAATAAKLDPSLDHTLLLVFYDYLPDLAE